MSERTKLRSGSRANHSPYKFEDAGAALSVRGSRDASNMSPIPNCACGGRLLLADEPEPPIPKKSTSRRPTPEGGPDTGPGMPELAAKSLKASPAESGGAADAELEAKLPNASSSILADGVVASAWIGPAGGAESKPEKKASPCGGVDSGAVVEKSPKASPVSPADGAAPVCGAESKAVVVKSPKAPPGCPDGSDALEAKLPKASSIIPADGCELA